MSQPVVEPTPTVVSTTTEPTYTPPASQADLDKIITERLTRERAKYADHGDLKKKAQQWDEVEAKSRTDLENATANAEAEKARADAAELRATRAEVAATRGVPANLLAGATQEELEASADALLAFRGDVKPPPPPTVTVLTPGNGSAAEKSVAAGASMFRERRKPPTTKE